MSTLYNHRPHAFHLTGHDTPVLSPVRVSLELVPFDQSPSLHPLRDGWLSRLVRRLRGYYDSVRLPMFVHRKITPLDLLTRSARLLVAVSLGGLTLFVWMFVAHEFLGLGEMGVGEIPNEAVVLNAMRGAIPETGLYIFPGFGLGPKPTNAQRNAAMPEYMKKYERSPHGVLVYHSPSGPFSFGA